MGSRETILAALFAALQRIADIELVERERINKLDDDTKTAVILFDGDLTGGTDRPAAATMRRNPTFKATLEPRIWCYVEGKHSQIGSLASDLYNKVVSSVWTDQQFLDVLAQHGAGLQLAGMMSLVTSTAGASASKAFIILVEIPFDLDPRNP